MNHLNCLKCYPFSAFFLSLGLALEIFLSRVERQNFKNKRGQLFLFYNSKENKENSSTFKNLVEISSRISQDNPLYSDLKQNCGKFLFLHFEFRE